MQNCLVHKRFLILRKMTHPIGLLAPKRYWLDLQMSFYVSNTQLKGLQNYGRSKFVVKKKLRHFGFEATPFATLFSESLLSGRPGFESRSLKTLRASNFKAFWPAGSKTSFFEISDLYLLGQKENKHFAALLRHIILSQSTPKSYHNWAIVRELLRFTVL